MMSVYLRETPSAEPFNADPELVEILNKNQTIIDTHSPLFILHPTISDDNGTNAQSNISLLHIITFTHLYKFRRFPESEKLYSSEFSKKVKEKYGSSLVYLKARLGFCTLGEDHVSNLRFDRLGCRIEYFGADEGLVDGLDYKVIKNEWPYAIENGYQFVFLPCLKAFACLCSKSDDLFIFSSSSPSELCRHLIVWSRLKLLNPALSPSTYHWRLATGEGLSGFVNLSNPMKDRLKSFNLLNKLNEEVQVEDVQSIRLDREIVKFVKNRWKLEEGYSDLIWFLNPVQLQSCPGLPHFHVFVKSQRS